MSSRPGRSWRARWTVARSSALVSAIWSPVAICSWLKYLVDCLHGQRFCEWTLSMILVGLFSWSKKKMFVYNKHFSFSDKLKAHLMLFSFCFLRFCSWEVMFFFGSLKTRKKQAHKRQEAINNKQGAHCRSDPIVFPAVDCILELCTNFILLIVTKRICYEYFIIILLIYD